MRKRSITIFFILAVLFAVRMFAVEIGTEAPKLEVQQWLRGALIDFSVPEYLRKDSSKLTVVVCWGTWLTGARDVTPLLEQLQNKYSDKEFRIILISAEPKAAIEKFFADNKNFPCYVAQDKGEKTTRAYMGQSRLFPKTFLIDEAGNLVWSGEAFDLPNIIKTYYDRKFSVNDWKKLGKLYEELEIQLRSRLDQTIVPTTDQILALNPDDGFAIRARLFYYDSARQPEQAIKFLETRIKITPHNAGIYLATFNILNGQRPLDTAKLLEFASTYLKNFEKEPIALQQLALILLRDFGYTPGTLELSAKILPLLEKAADITPAEKSAIQTTVALYQYKIGRLDKAVAAQREAIRLLPAGENAAAEQLLKFYESALRLHGVR